MAVKVHHRALKLRRLANFIDYSKAIQTYDTDNLYPQRVGLLADESGVTTSCIDNLAIYITGQGFENEQLSLQSLNPFFEVTADQLLREICMDKAKYNSFALHVNYNIKGQIVSIMPLSSKNCRFGVQFDDMTRQTKFIAYSINWDYYTADLIWKQQQIEYYHVFNPDPKKVKEEIKEAGGIANYKGQILYATPKKWQYPKCIFDAVLNDVQFDAEKKVFNLSSIINRFNVDYLIKYYGTFANEEERRAFTEEIEGLTGSENAGSTMAVEIDARFVKDGGSIGNMIEAIPKVDTDKLYTNTTKDSKDSIIEKFQVPKVLIGIYPDGGLINQAQFKEAHEIYNVKTRMLRYEISEKLKPVFDNFYINLGGNYQIKQLEIFENAEFNNPI